MASYLMNQNGFTNVTNMAGGMSVLKDNRCKKLINSTQKEN
jgi:rhodanese-related sulfurtransferase